MTDYPEPLTPAGCDLQDFPFMPLHVARLRDSDLANEESPEACWYALLLWAASWHQLPAGSLPDNEAVLTKLIGLGRDVRTFRKHRAAAMRGFVKCADGRLYHPVVAEQVIEAWERKRQQRWRSECARIKKANQRNGTTLPSPTYEQFLQGVSPVPDDPSPQSVPGDTVECPSAQVLQETGTGTVKKEKSFALVGGEPPTEAGRVDPETVRQAFAGWNDLAKRAGLPVARDLTDDRRKRIGSRLRAVGLDGWQSVLATVEASDFCRGGGDRGWRISLDDLFQTKTWNKLRDGGYGAVKAGPQDIQPETWTQLVAMWRGGSLGPSRPVLPPINRERASPKTSSSNPSLWMPLDGQAQDSQCRKSFEWGPSSRGGRPLSER